MDSSQTHSYGTRKSNNIPIRPSHRLRPDSDDPSTASSSRDQPHHHQHHHHLLPHFPPSHVVLHPDDANSKVFLSIGRAFLSVDNRAMTIKDLAEMVLNFGLVAQNVSAASQAITTYIRMHLQRCEAQQDIPLLLRHVLSGTDADDDLLPALASRTGGAQCSVHPEGRITNFRRGTMVWYLSRATGASCPFARAGIRLCDYGENGKVGPVGTSTREQKKPRALQRQDHDLSSCGQKRKRSLRSCAAPTLHAGSDSDSESDRDKPLPKVKLTLRLKPLAKSVTSSSEAQSSRNIIDLTGDLDDSDSDCSDSSMSVDDDDDDDDDEPQQQESRFCLPVYPRRSISIPAYTPSESFSRCPPASSSSSAAQLYRRSPSLAYSISSPPPESDVEEDDARSSMTRPRRHIDDFSEEEEDQDEIATHDWTEGGLDLDSEGDGETLWESPGPRSPSAPLVVPPLAELKVKEEPRDVQGMLDAWDHFDSSVAGARVVEVIAQAAAVLNPEAITNSNTNIKIESQDPWDWDTPFRQQQQRQQEQQHQWGLDLGEETIRIKQEDFDFGIDSLFPSMGGDSLELEEEEEVQDAQITMPIQRRATTAPIPQSRVLTSSSSSSSPPPQTIQPAISIDSTTTNSSSPLNIPPPMSPGAAALVQLIQALSVHSPTSPTAGSAPSVADALPTLTSTPTILPSSLLLPSGITTTTTTSSQSRQTCVSPQAMKVGPVANPGKGEAEGVVVHTCHPCSPTISATQIEEISVYQMMLGPYLLLRRIDTDFVNLTPIVEWCGKGRGYPVLSMVPNAVVVGRGWGSEKVCGVWVPLEVAQSYVKDLDTCSTGPRGKDDVTEGLNVFLNDELVERFPSALKDFHRTNASGRMLKQFGRWFESMVTCAQAQTMASTVASGNGTVPSSVASGSPLNPQRMIQGDTRQSWMQKEMIVPMPMTGAFALGAVLSIGERDRFTQNHQHYPSQQQVQLSKKEGGEQDSVDVVSPLSAREQEIFRELCVIPGEEEEREEEEEEEEVQQIEVEKNEEEEEDIPKVVVNVNGDPACVSVCVVTAAAEDLKSQPPCEEVVTAAGRPAVGMRDRHSSSAASPPDISMSEQKTIVTRSTRAMASKAAEKLLQEKQQALRRSKRVADAVAAQTQQQQQRTRSRKRPGSRNTLS